MSDDPNEPPRTGWVRRDYDMAYRAEHDAERKAYVRAYYRRVTKPRRKAKRAGEARGLGV
jgi:hypothetical protein